MSQIRWTEPAHRDVCDVLASLHRTSPRYAKRVHRLILAAEDWLEQEVFWGHEVPEFGREDVREVLVAKYRMVYLIQDSICHIVAFVHASRRLETFRPRLEQM